MRKQLQQSGSAIVLGATLTGKGPPAESASFSPQNPCDNLAKIPHEYFSMAAVQMFVRSVNQFDAVMTFPICNGPGPELAGVTVFELRK